MQETRANVELQVPEPGDLDALLALSNAHEREVGTMSKAAFEDLVAMSFRTRMAQSGAAFLVALGGRAPTVAPNYRWFAARLDRFVYVDRIVVAERARKQGLGRLLYCDLMQAARRGGYGRICCEVNVIPPNPGSDAFHAAFGFTEIGRAFLPDRGKTVRYLSLELKDSRNRAQLFP